MRALIDQAASTIDAELRKIMASDKPLAWHLERGLSLTISRAVIETMTTPTPEMETAGVDMERHFGRGLSKVRTIWAAMISVALWESEGERALTEALAELLDGADNPSTAATRPVAKPLNSMY